MPQEKGGSGPLSFLSNFLWSCIGITAGAALAGALLLLVQSATMAAAEMQKALLA